MLWTKQQVGMAVAVATLSLLSGGAAGFVLGSRYHKQPGRPAPQSSAAHQENTDSAFDTDVDPEESASRTVSSNGRHAGTRFLAARREDTPKKDVLVAANTATNATTNATVAAAETGATPRSRRSRRTP